MTQAQAALVPDRLPWLPEEAAAKEPSNRVGGRELTGWLVAAALLVAGTAYVVADKTFRNPSDVPQPWSPSTTAILPQLPSDQQTGVARPVTDGHSAVSMPTPDKVDAVPSSPVPTNAAVSPVVSHPAPQPKAAAGPKIVTPPARTVSAGHRLLPVNSSSSAAALIDMPSGRSLPSPLSGRVIHLGAFADIRQARGAWRDMERAYPPLHGVRASLIQNRDWNGQPFYQFELGTASQADSEILCQRLVRLSYRCAVVGPRGGKR
ncbi:MAG TPA: hypothetical protein VH392_07340 [Sphingomicrobium sp.]|jgi:hypothetical protein